MRDPIILLVHLIATLARLMGPGCFRHQLLLPRPYLVLTKPLRLKRFS